MMQTHDSNAQRQDSSLHVLIIGAGPCGLSCAIAISLAGHRATVFESVSRLDEVGAGLQITPNGSRLLHRWGVDTLLMADATKPALLRIHRFSGELLAQRTNYEHEVQAHYGAPLWGLHRVDLQLALARRAQELGVMVRLATKVVDMNFGAPAVTLTNGDCVAGDLLVAADGLWSSTRRRFLGQDTSPLPTGHMAYRMLIPIEQLSDSDLESGMAKLRNNIWIGPEAHAVTYPIRQGKLLNVVVLITDDLAQDMKREKGDIEELRRRLLGWDPMQVPTIPLPFEKKKWLTSVCRFIRYLTYVQKVDKWRLYHRENLLLAHSKTDLLQWYFTKIRSRATEMLAKFIGHVCYGR